MQRELVTEQCPFCRNALRPGATACSCGAFKGRQPVGCLVAPVVAAGLLVTFAVNVWSDGYFGPAVAAVAIAAFCLLMFWQAWKLQWLRREH